MRRFILVIALAMVGVAQAAPSVSSAEECATVADMVVVQRAFEKNAVAPDVASALLADFYDESIAEDPKWREILSLAAAFARRDAFKTVSPVQLGEAVRVMCMRLKGNLDSIFGAGT